MKIRLIDPTFFVRSGKWSPMRRNLPKTYKISRAGNDNPPFFLFGFTD